MTSWSLRRGERVLLEVFAQVPGQPWFAEAAGRIPHVRTQGAEHERWEHGRSPWDGARPFGRAVGGRVAGWAPGAIRRARGGERG